MYYYDEINIRVSRIRIRPNEFAISHAGEKEKINNTRQS